MPWPRPEFVLYVLGTFLAGYGISMILRALRGRRWHEPRETCPECRRPWTPGSTRCGSCGAAPPPAAAIRAWKRFVVLGIAVSATGGLVFLAGIAVADWIVGMHAFGGTRSLARLGPVLGAGIGLSIFGLYVAVVGFRGQRSNGRRRCPKCWYLIDEALGMKCSECGHEAARERDLFRPRRRGKVVLLGLVLIAIGQFGWMEARVRSGGWLAAVPTEVLVLGMPWLPDDCLRHGVSQRENWSLAGRSERINGPRHRLRGMWRWQKPWAESRAASRTMDARNADEALPRFDLTMILAAGSNGTPDSDASTRAFVHSIDLSIDALATPGSLSAPVLVQQASVRSWRYGYGRFGGRDAIPAVAELINRRTPDLLAILTNGPDESKNSAATLLALGDGRPEVIDALIDAASKRAASDSLRTLVARHESVEPLIVAVLRDPSDPRRGDVARAVRFMPISEPLPAIDEALFSRFTDSDLEVAFLAAAALYTGDADDKGLRAFDQMIVLSRRDSAYAARTIEVLEYGQVTDLAAARLPLVFELTASQAPELAQLGFTLLVSLRESEDPRISAEVVRLLDAGLTLPGWMTEEWWRGRAASQNSRPPEPPV